MTSNSKINHIIKGDPRIGYVYFDLSDADVRWNVARGVINTTAELQKIYPNSTMVSFFMKSRIEKGVSSLELELKLEETRKQYYPNKPSRLLGLFYFPNKSDAENAQKYINVKHFQNVCLQEVAIDPNAKMEVFDMNWITLYKDYKDKYPSNWMNLYWQGKECNIQTKENIPTIWESITESGFIIPDKNVREECIERLKQDDEQCCALLYLSIAAAHYGYILGYAFYCLTKSKNNKCNYLQLGMVVTDEMMVSVFKELEKDDLSSANAIRNLIIKYNSLKVPDSTSKGYCLNHHTSTKNCPNFN